MSSGVFTGFKLNQLTDIELKFVIKSAETELKLQWSKTETVYLYRNQEQKNEVNKFLRKRVTVLHEVLACAHEFATLRFYRAMHFSAKCGLAITCRPSVTLMDCDHIGWKSWKLIAQTISQHLRSL